MKIGYKIIIGSALIFFVSKPAHSVLERYKVFKEQQQTETAKLLHSFKTRPENFFKNPNYESTVKSFLEKNIKNIELDLNAKEEPLAVDQAVTEPVVSTETAIESQVVTKQAIKVDDENINKLAELEKQKELNRLKEIEKQNEAVKQKELEKLKEIEKLKDIEKAKRIAKEQELQKQKELDKKKELEKKKAQELAAKVKVEEFQYFVQLGVFSSVENANILVKQAGAGFIVVKSSVNDKQYVVRSKPGKKSDMEALSAKVKNLGLTPIVRVW